MNRTSVPRETTSVEPVELSKQTGGEEPSQQRSQDTKLLVTSGDLLDSSTLCEPNCGSENAAEKKADESDSKFKEKGFRLVEKSEDDKKSDSKSKDRKKILEKLAKDLLLTGTKFEEESQGNSMLKGRIGEKFATDDKGGDSEGEKNIKPNDQNKTRETLKTDQKVPELLPNVNCRPIILATHLVPSLPIGLFEILVEVIEAALGIPSSILYEPRFDRPVAKEVTDIAVLASGITWEDGTLLPVSFVFEHKMNKTFSPEVYVDVIVATERAHHVESLMDLRGHRCAVPDRNKHVGATTLLFNELRIKGDGPAFFGNILDANSQIGALQMGVGKQVEVCVLESPVFKNHRKSMPGVYTLHVLKSLGPLPPYPIFVNKDFSTDHINKIKTFLLDIHKKPEWLAKFAPYSVQGFAEYIPGCFKIPKGDIKPVKISGPYY